jgi:hypothetical protein
MSPAGTPTFHRFTRVPNDRSEDAAVARTGCAMPLVLKAGWPARRRTFPEKHPKRARLMRVRLAMGRAILQQFVISVSNQAAAGAARGTRFSPRRIARAFGHDKVPGKA